MSTPAMVLSSLMKLMVISVGVFWVVSFCVSRFFVFYESYIEFQNVLKDEAWLLAQCTSPEFYSNLRQHTELCDNVRRNAERSPVLIALNSVAETAHLCGRYSCTEALTSLSNAGWPAIAAVVASALLTPTLLARIVHRTVLPVHADNRAMHLKYL
jgi:hypothetical protein